MSVVVICDQWTGPGAPSRPARRTRIRRRPAAGAPAAGARVGGQSAARPTAGAAGRAIRRTTCGPIRSESTTSRRHCQSRPGRCCDPVPQALATDRSAACMPDRLGRGVSGSPSRCLSRLRRWPCRLTPPARHPTPASRSQPIVWPRRVRHRAGVAGSGNLRWCFVPLPFGPTLAADGPC